MKLWPAMEHALELAARGGLVRRSGGYWIAGDDAGPGIDFDPDSGIEYVGTRIVRALESRGAVILDPDDDAPNWRRRRVLAEEDPS